MRTKSRLIKVDKIEPLYATCAFNHTEQGLGVTLVVKFNFRITFNTGLMAHTLILPWAYVSSFSSDLEQIWTLITWAPASSNSKSCMCARNNTIATIKVMYVDNYEVYIWYRFSMDYHQTYIVRYEYCTTYMHIIMYSTSTGQCNKSCTYQAWKDKSILVEVKPCTAYSQYHNVRNVH